jgi:hypothetical protein
MTSAVFDPDYLTPPRQATARNYSRATHGGRVAAVASAMKTPLIPWQKYVADVAGEIDAAGAYVYPIVLITVPRQAGKTTIDQASSIEACLQGPDRRVWYTAQSGQDANDKFREMTETWSGSPLKDLAGRPRLSNGSMSLTFINGSTARPHPPTVDALHGKQSDKNSVDEAWAFTELQGAQLMQAIVPTTATRQKATGQRPQLWILSTEGTIESTWLNALLARARAGDPLIAFFDWGIGPDVDPTDLPAVAAAHPGYHHLFEMSTLIDAAAALPPGEFARAYGNRRSGSSERVIPIDKWGDAQTLDRMPDGAVCLAAALGVDGVDATITATSLHPVLGKICEVIEHRPGTLWALDRLVQLATAHDAPVAIDPTGPSASLHDQATRAGLAIIPIKSSTYSAACANVLAGILAGSWHCRPHVSLNDAAELSSRRWISDGAWLWGRRASVGSISALEAVTLGDWGIDHMPERVGLQIF